MVLRIWIWRISLVLLVVFMALGFYRLSLHSFLSLFGAQLFASPYSYPSFQVFQNDLSDDQSLLTISLAPYESIVENPSPPEDLFLVLQSGDQEYRSDDQQRIDGYPFLQMSPPEGSSQLFLFHQLGAETLLVKELSLSEALASFGTLKGAAPLEEIQNSVRESFQFWHLIALGILFLLGGLYLYLRYQSLRASQGP